MVNIVGLSTGNLHENPVRAGFVKEPQDWLYSSAIDCYTNGKGLLNLVRID